MNYQGLVKRLDVQFVQQRGSPGQGRGQAGLGGG